jgi:hypothetical protein
MREGDFAPDGADIDDRSLASLQHLRQHCQGGMQRAEEVDIHRLVEAIERLALQGTNHNDAGIVNHDIDPAEMRGSRGHHLANRRLYAHIARVHPDISGRRAATGQEARLCSFQLVGVPRG